FLAPPLLRFVFPDPKTVDAGSEQLILDASSGTSLVIEPPQSRMPASNDSGNLETTKESGDI
ncbi:MAG: cation:proton antiporter, partial [Nostoc sp.]